MMKRRGFFGVLGAALLAPVAAAKWLYESRPQWVKIGFRWDPKAGKGTVFADGKEVVPKWRDYSAEYGPENEADILVAMKGGRDDPALVEDAAWRGPDGTVLEDVGFRPLFARYDGSYFRDRDGVLWFTPPGGVRQKVDVEDGVPGWGAYR